MYILVVTYFVAKKISAIAPEVVVEGKERSRGERVASPKPVHTLNLQSKSARGASKSAVVKQPEARTSERRVSSRSRSEK